MITAYLANLFYLDSLSKIVIGLVLVIATIVWLFSSRYMQGDTHFTSFRMWLVIITLAVTTMVAADHILLVLFSWGLSNYALIKLMVHKPDWQAAKNSGTLAGKTLGIGFMFLTLALALLYLATGETSLQAILSSKVPHSTMMLIALFLVALAGMTQSAIWPFHRWLLSSLNSPTPVSALMHAGLVNGGGFLLIRFAPLLASHSFLLEWIFGLGLATALIGTFWKLVQTDVKRMLACSTVAQMGYMLVECALGLFPLALLHLCWHGFFKSYLFLAANGTAVEKRQTIPNSPTLLTIGLAMVCGGVAVMLFSQVTHIGISADTTLFIPVLCFISATQLGLVLLRRSPWLNLPLAIAVIAVLSVIYGFNLHLFESLLGQAAVNSPQPLTVFHVVGLALLVVTWLARLVNEQFKHSRWQKAISTRLYVKALNFSQPHPETITNHRYQYTYKEAR